jgi:hypothetical protein
VDRHAKPQYGNHRVRLAIGRRTLRGRAGVKDMQTDPKVNRRHVAESELGTIELKRAGRHTFTLRAEQVAKVRRGFTATGIRLARV